MVVVRDITERKRAEEALHRVNVELEGYAHTVSHDLRGSIGAASLAFGMLNRAIEEAGIPREDAGSRKAQVAAGEDLGEEALPGHRSVG